MSYLPELSFAEAKLIAELLTLHVNGDSSPLTALGDRVANHLDQKGLLSTIEPLPLRMSTKHPYEDRLMFCWASPVQQERSAEPFGLAQ